MEDQVLKIHVAEEAAGQSVERFLRIGLGLSRKQISRLKFREEGIRLNGLRQRVTQTLHTGDLLEVRLETGGEKAGKVEACSGIGKLKILYEDRDLLAVEKPAGLVCHPSHGHWRDTLSNLAAAYLREQGTGGMIRLLGRLDKDTSGILLFAKNREAAGILARQRGDGNLEKTYLALAEGCPEPAEGTVDAPIQRIPGELMKMQVSPKGKAARTHYRVLRVWEKNGRKKALLQLKLEQGRTHQIRVHMAYLGCPLEGDPLYGTDPRGKGALLHAWKLRFAQPFTGQKIVLETELPPWCRGSQIKFQDF